MAKRKQDKKEEALKRLTAAHIWELSASQIVETWEFLTEDEEFPSYEEKILNIIRMAFEVVHYNPEDERDTAIYENGDWSIIARSDEKKGKVAFRKRILRNLNDLTYDNIRHVTAEEVLQFIANNFGGGWESISLTIKDIIESGFEISTTTLPPARLHVANGTWERKLADGFLGVEIAKGTWVEAVFAKKKAPMLKLHFATDSDYDEEGNRIDPREAKHARKLAMLGEMEGGDDDDDADVDADADEGDDADNADASRDSYEDETFYSSYIPEAEGKEDEDEDTEGLSVVE